MHEETNYTVAHAGQEGRRLLDLLEQRIDTLEEQCKAFEENAEKVDKPLSEQFKRLDDLEVIFDGMFRDGHLNTDGGDVLVDALLYERGPRTDEYVYVSLYGIPPHRARNLNKSIASQGPLKSLYVCRGCEKYERCQRHQYQGNHTGEQGCQDACGIAVCL